MSFVNQINQSQFFEQSIKVLKVLCKQCVHEIGEVTIPAPSNLQLIDPSTGQLDHVISLELIGPPQIRNITILPGKVINEGVVPVRLLVDCHTIHCLLEIPFQGIVECPGIEPGDNVQKHDIKVEGLIFSPVRLLDNNQELKLNLIIKVIVTMCVIVSRESIMKVNAANQFCCP